MFKVNNKDTRTKCKICSKLTIETPEQHHCRRSGVLIVNFEHFSHLVLVFQVNADWVNTYLNSRFLTFIPVSGVVNISLYSRLMSYDKEK